jgi:hypothetical protein
MSLREGALTAVQGVDRRKCNEYCKMISGLVNSVNTEGEIIHDGHGVFSAIDKMREYVSSVVVTTNALQRTPNTRKG